MSQRASNSNPPARHGRLIIAGCLVVIASSGCLRRGNVDLLEARLREQQEQLLQYEHQLTSVRSELGSARSEMEMLRRQIAQQGGSPIAPEHVSALVTVNGIQFNTLLTGGRNRDGSPGDEVLAVVITPHDEDGDLVKIGGEIEIEALDMSLPADSRQVGLWTFDAAAARERWHSGFVSAGFQFELPWNRAPASGNVIVHARLITPDGRQFDASHTVAVDPPVQLASQEVAAPPAPPAVPEERLVPEPVEIPKEWLQDASPATPATTIRGEDDTLDPVSPAPQPPARIRLDDNVAPLPGSERAPKRVSAPPAARPFPNGTQTSDSWTDATIPHLR
ncbi:hypothetical protein Mal4_41470 [Maioricimonas rarisocia]|uniref:Uncharacterized protein n=1 Tax=Maioricimonas rarisocia TaxID=2528026 RepID=A0A517ZBI7_9PLAN|nr:hypothetical protein [Maioricimonas rarisocia]QDU39800.1 hypothetical protein Mal4_41470 [Maioricimonas rarisocia]